MKSKGYQIGFLAAALGIVGACSPSAATSTGTGGNGSGGKTGTGGSVGNGGSTGSGGSSASGGTSATGGTIGSGGSGTGGAGTGGSAASGGSAGGSSAGGSQTGGSQSAGGASGATGGSASSDDGGTSAGGSSGTGGASAGGSSGTGGTGAGGSTSDIVDAGAVDVAIDGGSDTSQISKTDWNAYLPLATGTTDNSGQGTTEDVSGHGYFAGYGSGVSFSNAAMVVSGSGDVDISAKNDVPAIDVTKSYSVSVWVTMADTTAWRTFVSADGTMVSSLYLQLRSDSGHFAFTLSNSDSNDGVVDPCVAEASTPPDPDTLYHLVATRDADTGHDTLYVNGVQAGTRTCLSSDGPGWAASTFGIGHGMYNGSSTDYVSGSIADVGLMGRVLSADEVAALYAFGNK